MGGDPHTTTVKKNVSKNAVYMLIIMITDIFGLFSSPLNRKKGGAWVA